MKSRLIFCFLPVSLFLFIACSKELSKENIGHVPAPVTSDFYATIDGKSWDADSLKLVLLTSNGVSINGLSKTGEQISMLLPEFKLGTYSLSTQTASYALYANLLDSSTNVFVSNSGSAGGTLTISAIDTLNHLVSGTFQFNLANPADNVTKVITKGVFDNVTYSGDTTTVVTPPTGNSDTVEATIDGNKFFASNVQVSMANGQLLIAGFSGTQDIGLYLPPDVAAGTYDLDFTTGKYIGIYNPDPSVTLISQASGSVTILSHDILNKKIKGTFNFTASPTGSGTPAVITLGYFSVNY
ncbi:MAG TPA: DUF6252 family protein [Puia sp.]|jgi:hypothetical protein